MLCIAPLAYAVDASRNSDCPLRLRLRLTPPALAGHEASPCSPHHSTLVIRAHTARRGRGCGYSGPIE